MCFEHLEWKLVDIILRNIRFVFYLYKISFKFHKNVSEMFIRKFVISTSFTHHYQDDFSAINIFSSIDLLSFLFSRVLQQQLLFAYKINEKNFKGIELPCHWKIVCSQRWKSVNKGYSLDFQGNDTSISLGNI